MKKTFVIGAGIGGIASALRLKSINHDVKIFDRCKEIGGRAQKIIVDGYQHDTGPTVITAPYLFEELFKLFKAYTSSSDIDSSASNDESEEEEKSTGGIKK